MNCSHVVSAYILDQWMISVFLFFVHLNVLTYCMCYMVKQLHLSYTVFCPFVSQYIIYDAYSSLEKFWMKGFNCLFLSFSFSFFDVQIKSAMKGDLGICITEGYVNWVLATPLLSWSLQHHGNHYLTKEKKNK